jgi:7-cyano-7-deazaguanine reductase
MTETPDDSGPQGDTAPTMRRRAKLETVPNPDLSIDYLSVLQGATLNAAATVTLRYVPDKLILPIAAFAEYLAAFDATMSGSLEEIALAALSDINNEVVPRWVQIVAAQTGDVTASHQVLIEDRQPKWDNPALLARLERY